MKKNIVFIFSFFCALLYGQNSNVNVDKGAIQINLPKTPESQSFEKYGKIPVDESTGTIALTYPLVAIRGKELEVPLSLSYHASGIKISQESSWVGLGFDIIAGGRITVDTKGNIDENMRGITSLTKFKDGLKKIFESRGTSGHSPIMGWGWLDYGKLQGCDSSLFPLCGSAVWDDDLVVTNSAWYGISEPDIYHANFMGKNVDFYFDLIDDEIHFLNEKSLYSIITTRDSNGKISSFKITDNDGITYNFEQKETTKMGVNNSYGVYSFTESTTAWLLTSIVHPTGDKITFIYSNYGKIYPMINLSASISSSYPSQNATKEYSSETSFLDGMLEMTSYYLSKIESANEQVDFILGDREDIRGGAKKLEEIKLTQKLNNKLVKDIVFNYSYFVSSGEKGDYLLSSSNRTYANKRLKLTSFSTINSNGQSPQYKFFYNEKAIPGKLSYSQDHWGYYNGMTNDFYYYTGNPSPHNLIPTFSSLGNLDLRGFDEYIIGDMGHDHPNTVEGYGNRNCSSWACKVMMLDSIVYPTGGSTKLEFEPHISFYRDKNITAFVGGGVRIKSIKTYKNGAILDNSIEYKYESSDYGQTSGIYLGAIEYSKVLNKSIPNTASITQFDAKPTVIISSNGENNADNQTVGYSRVKTIYKYNNGCQSNGYVIKQFYYDHPYAVEYTNYFVYTPPTDMEIAMNFYTPFNLQGLKFLQKERSGIAPSPNTLLEGKIKSEDYYDSQNNLLQSVNYYYHQADYSEKYYSMRVEDNYIGCFGLALAHVNGDNGGGYYSGNVKGFGYLRWGLTLFPAKSYYTLTDSVITKNYFDSKVLKNIKSFKYNSNFQPQYEINENSDGVKNIVYTKRVRDFTNWAGNTSGPLVGDGLELSEVLTAHMIDMPVEQLVMTKKANSDTLVTSGIYYKFKNKQISSIFKTNLNQGKKFNQDFNPSFINTSKDITIDPSYSLTTKVNYDKFNQVIQTQDKAGVNTSYLWGYNNQYMVAQVIGSDSTTVKSKISQQTLDNPDSDAALQTELNKLRTISGAQVTTYTYSPFIGVTSITDPRGIKNTFEYDNLGRLTTSKDNSSSLTGKYTYNYQTSANDGLEGYTSISAVLSCTTPDVVVDSVGVANVSVTGGSNDFTYNWYLYDPSENLTKSALNTINTSFSFTSHVMGTNVIKCVVTDNKTGQTIIVTKLIKIRSLLIVTMTTQLYSSTAGRSQVTVSGGSGTYTYSWYFKDHSDNILSKSENSSQNYWYFGTTYKGPVTVSCYVYDTVKKVSNTVYYDFTTY